MKLSTRERGDMNYKSYSLRRAGRVLTVLAIALPLLAGWQGGAVAAPAALRAAAAVAAPAALRAAAGGLTPPTQSMTPQKSIGKGEGQLNLIAWEGYTQPQ